MKFKKMRRQLRVSRPPAKTGRGETTGTLRVWDMGRKHFAASTSA